MVIDFRIKGNEVDENTFCLLISQICQTLYHPVADELESEWPVVRLNNLYSRFEWLWSLYLPGDYNHRTLHP